MRGLIVALWAATLCACSSTKETYTSEGSMVYAISCQLQSVDSCIEKAGELCGSLGYRFVLPDGTPGPSPATVASAPAPVAEAVSHNRDTNRDTVVPATTPASTPATITEPTKSSAGNVLNRKFYVRCQTEDRSS